MFFSEEKGQRNHHWNQVSIKSRKYPPIIKDLVEKILSTIRCTAVINQPSVLVPVYTRRYDKLNLHNDNLNGEFEMVVNIYFGQSRKLIVKSNDNRFTETYDCEEGTLRIFSPLMNEMVKHGKLSCEEKNVEEHYALSIRQSSNVQRVNI